MAELVIRSSSGDEQRIQLEEEEYVLGRDPTVSIPLRDRKVSRQHARIFLKGASYHIEDLGSVNGVLVDGVPFQGSRKLAPGNEYDVGGFLILYVPGTQDQQRAFSFTGKTAPFADQEFLLPQGELEVGRVDGNAIVIPDTSVSRNHALVVVTQRTVAVHDLGSSNGTLVNGNRVSKRTLAPGDVVAFGNVEFEFQATGSSAVKLPAALGVLRDTSSASKIAIALAGASAALLIGTLVYLLAGGTGSSVAPISPREYRHETEIDDSLKRADLAVQEEDWEKAIESYHEVLDKDPIHVRARDDLRVVIRNQEHGRALQRARNELNNRSYRAAITTAMTVPSTAYHAEAAAKIASSARKQLVSRLVERANIACRRQEWSQCQEDAIEAFSLSPQSLELLSLIEQAETAMRSQEIEFSKFERPVTDESLQMFARHSDPRVRSAVSRYIEDDLEGALRSVSTINDSDKGRELSEIFSKLKQELDAADLADQAGNARSAIEHWQAALHLDARVLPVAQGSPIRTRLERNAGTELYGLGELAFRRGMHIDAFHYWSKGARLAPRNVQLQQGLERLEKQGVQTLKELDGDTKASCALIREVLATTQPSSPTNIKAKSASQKYSCHSS